MRKLACSIIVAASIFLAVSACDSASNDTKICGREDTYSGIKALIFDISRQDYDGNVKFINDLEKDLKFTISEPVATDVSPEISKVDCEGRATIYVPSPLIEFFGNRKEITADIGYSAQNSADGKGVRYQIGGENTIISAIRFAANMQEIKNIQRTKIDSINLNSVVDKGHDDDFLFSETESNESTGSRSDGYATVESFYIALGAADGFAANSLISPEKRKNPAYRVDSLTKFYGSLSEPLRIIEIKQLNSNEFIVDYRWKMNRKTCNGRSSVTINSIGQQSYIKNIRTINGC